MRVRGVRGGGGYAREEARRQAIGAGPPFSAKEAPHVGDQGSGRTAARTPAGMRLLAGLRASSSGGALFKPETLFGR